MKRFASLLIALSITSVLYAGFVLQPFKGKAITRASFNDTSSRVALDYSESISWVFLLSNIDSAYGSIYIQGLVGSVWHTLETIAVDTAELSKAGIFRLPTLDSLQGVEQIRAVFNGGCIGNDSTGSYTLQILTK